MAKLLFKKPKDKQEEQKAVNLEALLKESQELRDELEKILALDDINFLSEEASKRLEFIHRRMLEIARTMNHN